MPDEGAPSGVRPFWSGTISFGLVSIPVSLYSATRTERLSLRMLSPSGAPLRREYHCPEHGTAVDSDDIVRGYELPDGGYVIVTDEELEALEPRKSRDIDLRRFVDRNALRPLLFERAYFLAPASESTKAYRLLAQTLERTARAGIATFVMRGKEYLVAILSEGGILRAETLRFVGEIRSPDDIGLPEHPKVDSAEVTKMRHRIRKLAKKSIATSELEDEQLEKVQKLVQKKLESGQDIVEPPEAAREEGRQGADVIDLMEVLKRSLEPGQESRPASRGGRSGGAGRRRSPARRSDRGEALAKQSKQELYERAKALDIQGRSQMTKPELIDAIQHAS